MSAILTLIYSLFSGLPGLVGDYFKKKQELQQIELEGKIALEKANRELAAKIAESQAELTKTVVSSTGPYFKYFTFAMWFGPFILCTISPSSAAEVFRNWDIMPDWYIQSCQLIMFTIWGIQVSAPAVNRALDRLDTYLSNRRDYKLEKHKIDRAAYYAAVRKSSGGIPIPQEYVDTQEKIFDAMEGK